MTGRPTQMQERVFLPVKDKLKLAKDELLAKDLEPGGRPG